MAYPRQGGRTMSKGNFLPPGVLITPPWAVCDHVMSHMGGIQMNALGT